MFVFTSLFNKQLYHFFLLLNFLTGILCSLISFVLALLKGPFLGAMVEGLG